jgi:tetratricopeptide (TPR) repeat protein
MEIKNRLVDLLQRAQEEERALVVSLSDSGRSAIGTPERWSAKDVVAHLAEWRARTAANLAAARRGEPVSSYDDIDAANAETFQRYRDWPWRDVLGKSESSHSQLIERVQGMTEDELADTQFLPWQHGRPLWRVIAGNEYAHPISHLAICYAEHGDADRATLLQETAAQLLAPLDDSPGWQGTIRYNLACHYALIGMKEQAIARLTEALRLYPDLAEWARQDTDLASIREEPAFQKLTETGGSGSSG